MAEKTTGYRTNRWSSEGIISAISIGLFFVILGLVFVINQNLDQRIIDFAKDFTSVPVSGSNVNLPVPGTVAAHTAVYAAAFQFALGIGILQILVLALRLTLGSRRRRTAETVGNLVFWFGAAYLISNLANIKSSLAISQQQVVWWQFWASIVILFGLCLIVQGIILLVTKRSLEQSVTKTP